MPGLVDHYRPRWPHRVDHLRVIEEVFQMYLNEMPPHLIAQEYMRRHPGERMSKATAQRCISRARALIAGTYVKDMQRLGELMLARRYSLISEAWQEVQRIEADQVLDRFQKAKAKESMMKIVEANQSAIEKMLGLQMDDDSKAASESKTLIVIAGNKSADRIAGMSELLNQRLSEGLSSNIIDQPSE